MKNYSAPDVTLTVAGQEVTGFWVELENIFVEGYVRKDSLPSDIWDYDKKHHQIKGLRSGTTYRLGDKLNVRVVKINMTRAQADFEIMTSK